MTDQVTIPARFNGPPGSGNGGYACGLVADAIGAAAAVRLTAPPPLETGMARVHDEDGVVRLTHGEVVVAEGRPGLPAVEAPVPPAWQEAERAPLGYRGRDPQDHPFPTCFVCGPEREEDGLRIFPGPAGGSGLLACTWTPTADLATDGVVEPALVWAAMDCPSGFACMPPDTLTVLASMTAQVEAPVHAGRDYIVSAWPVASDGRKHSAGAALHERDGQRVALAEALWITPRS
jgi:hypothetical protein